MKVSVMDQLGDLASTIFSESDAVLSARRDAEASVFSSNKRATAIADCGLRIADCRQRTPRGTRHHGPSKRVFVAKARPEDLVPRECEMRLWKFLEMEGDRCGVSARTIYDRWL